MNAAVTSPLARIWRHFAGRIDALADRPLSPDRHYLYFSVGPALVLLVAAAALYLSGGYHAGFGALNSLAAALPECAWSSITHMGDTAFALALLLFFAHRHPELLWPVLLASLIGLVATHVPKDVFSLARPPAVLDPADFFLIGDALERNSFPSGHSQTALTLVAVMAYVLRTPWQRVALLAAGLTIAASRVVVGVHWPIDILVGGASGLLCGALGVWLSTRWRAGHNRYVALFVLFLIFYAGGMLAGGFEGDYPLARPAAHIIGISALAFGIFQFIVRPVTTSET